MAFAEPSVMAPACGDNNEAPEAITAGGTREEEIFAFFLPF